MMKRAIGIGLIAIGLAGSAFARKKYDASSPGQQSAQAVAPESRIEDCIFRSESLGRPMHYRVLLPAGYSESGQYYPVLYLLHGWHGDYQNWTTLTNLTSYVKGLPIIVVMPDAGDSWYVDSATVPQEKFEQYIVRDLTAEVNHRWRSLRSPHRTAIAGLSMGGYAAINLALKYPGTFEVAASISGAFNAPLAELEQRADLRPSLERAFGSPNSKTRTENDVYQLAANADVKSAPYLFIDCGNADVTFLEPNRRLAAVLSQKKFRYEYHEFPGAHTWQYWDEHIPAVLKVVVEHIAAEVQP